MKGVCGQNEKGAGSGMNSAEIVKLHCWTGVSGLTNEFAKIYTTHFIIFIRPPTRSSTRSRPDL
jgi:hypothetical protein